MPGTRRNKALKTITCREERRLQPCFNPGRAVTPMCRCSGSVASGRRTPCWRFTVIHNCASFRVCQMNFQPPSVPSPIGKHVQVCCCAHSVLSVGTIPIFKSAPSACAPGLRRMDKSQNR